jgi:hypothetical protein
MKLLLCLFPALLCAQTSVLVTGFAGDVGTVSSGTTATYKAHPDNSVTATPTQVVQFTGQDITIFDKLGNITQQVGGNAWWIAAGGAAGFKNTDPRAYYDPFVSTGRTVATVTDNNGTNSWVAVSAGQDATGTYKSFTLPVTAGVGDDTPKAGFSKNGLVVGRFTSNGGGLYDYYAYTNSQLAWTGGGSPGGTAAGVLNNGPYEAILAIDYNASKSSSAPDLLIARTGPAQTGTNVALNIIAIQVTWSGGVATFAAPVTINSASYLYNTPLTSVTQPVGAWTGDVETHRVFGAQWDTLGNVWTVVGSGPCASSCGSLPSGGKNGFYWFKLDPVGLTILDSGYIFAASDYSYPTIVVDSNNVVHISIVKTDASTYSSVVEFWRAPGDAAGTLQGPQLLKAGTSNLSNACGIGGVPVGSYEQSALDPADPTKVWHGSQAALSATTCQWTTWFTEMTSTLPTSASSVGGGVVMGGGIIR